MALPNTWVIAQPKKTLIVGVADMIASNDSSTEIVTYSLGSCLGIAVYDPVKKVGGLLHIMLPDSSIDTDKARTSPYMFVDSGVPKLFHSVYNLGGDRSRLTIRVAGGAQFLDEKRVFNIGERNYKAFKEIIARNGMRITAEDVGGKTSRTVRLELATGKFSIHSPGVPPFSL